MNADLEKRRAYLGAQNDAWFIVHGEAPAQNNDYPRHDADRVAIAKVFDYDSCTRLVACWNACCGLSNEQLERCDTLDYANVSRDAARNQYIYNLASQRDSLLEALQTLVKRIEFYTQMGELAQPNIEQWEYTEGSADMTKARTAIAKALGSAS